MSDLPRSTLEVDTSGELWWCNTHKRRATHICVRHTAKGEFIDRKHECTGGGIMLPCQCVNLTGLVEFKDDVEAERGIAEQALERD
jgi:hypothetical protein